MPNADTSPEDPRAKAAAHRGAVDRRNAERWKRPGAGQVKKTYDALTRQIIDEELVRQGKLAEMEFLRQWTVYEYATYDECMAETGKKQYRLGGCVRTKAMTPLPT